MLRCFESPWIPYGIAHLSSFSRLVPVVPVFIDMSSSSYFEVIKNPMDLSTMSAKLEEGMYKDRFAFEGDFSLMISNAKRYNVAGSYAYTEAIAIETLFEKRELPTLHGIRAILS